MKSTNGSNTVRFPSHVTSYRANSPTEIGTSTHLVTLRRHRGRDPIFDLGCRWWTTLLSLEYVLAECTAPAMACFLDTRSESNCKEHLTDRYRAMASYQLMGSLMDHHTGNSIGHLVPRPIRTQPRLSRVTNRRAMIRLQR